MGNETSQIEKIISNTPPRALKFRTLEGVATYIKDGQAKRIVVMTGAGISTSAGIPDFRSPETGLYANLARLDLPYAEAVFDISYFRKNPEPFYVLAKELYPGRFYPTISHAFIALLHYKGLLLKLLTQNIDCLERRAGVPREKVVEAHGSFATQRCIECKTEFPGGLMVKAVEAGEVPHCLVPQCNGLVKPDIVFFGESLPPSFFMNRNVPGQADLVIVMGTSLSVHPFAALPSLAERGVPRVLFNLEKVGDFETRTDDVVILGDCDEGVKKLADALGWREELDVLWLEVGGKVSDEEAARLREERQAMSKDELLESEVDKITMEVEESLNISKGHVERVRKHLDGEYAKILEKNQMASSSDSSSVTTEVVPGSEESFDDLPGVSGFEEPLPTPAVGGFPKGEDKMPEVDYLLGPSNKESESESESKKHKSVSAAKKSLSGKEGLAKEADTEGHVGLGNASGEAPTTSHS